MEDIAGWIAPIATMIAAIMTASNLGARVTGWGFVVFTIGSLAWVAVAVATGQQNLLATNAFLTLVNAIGIWRWLGRQARYEDDSRRRIEASKASDEPTLVSANGMIGMPVRCAGQQVGKVVEVMLECGTGQLHMVVMSSGGLGGVGERLSAIGKGTFDCRSDRIELEMTKEEAAALPEWNPDKAAAA